MRRRTQLIGAAVAVAVVAGTAAWIVSAGQDGTEESALVERSTDTVTRETLTSAETRDGAVAYADEATIWAASSGVLTHLAPAGATVRRGKVLYRINQQPTVLMYGSVPAYRTMQAGSSGSDVQQLERNLRELGYRGFTVDRSFTYDTADAVSEWQDDLGVSETGIVQLGQVDFQPGAVRVGAASAEIGERVAPGTPLAAISGVSQAVTVTLDESDRDLAKTGDRVRIDLGSVIVAGRVAAVDAEAQVGQDGSSTTTYEVTVAVAEGDASRIRELPEGAAVDVDFAADRAVGVLTVPVKALLALAEGGYGVELVGEGGATTIVAVTPGMFADGRVEVESEALAAGDTVVVAP